MSLIVTFVVVVIAAHSQFFKYLNQCGYVNLDRGLL